VGGTVNVGNLPLTQQVQGTVNVGNFPTEKAPPLWQGTPYVESFEIVSGGECRSFEIPEGMILFAERVTATIFAGESTGDLLLADRFG
jgi:hypothetical protein